MRGFGLFIAGLLCGLAVQTTMAQGDGAGTTGVVLNHVGLAVPSIPDAAAFYMQKLGFKEAFRNSDPQGNPTAIYLQISKTTFLELQQANAQRPAGISHFGLEAPNIKNTVATYKTRGAMATDPGRAQRVLARHPGQCHRPERPAHRARRDGARVAPAKGDGQLEMKKLGVTAVAWLLGAAWAGGQAPAARAPMAEEVFKNVQILKGIPVDQFMGTMGFFSASLGLNCTDCHVDESGGNWAKYADDNPKKQTARRMMQMVAALNRTSFGGRQVVTCNTCHRGNSRPNVHAEPRAAVRHTAARRAGRADHPGAGAAARRTGARQVSSRRSAVPQRSPRSPALPPRAPTAGSTMRRRARRNLRESSRPAHARSSTRLSGDSTTTYDGRAGWIAAPEIEKPVPVFPITGQELDGVKLEAELWFPVAHQAGADQMACRRAAVTRRSRGHGRSGNTANGATATLCFDAESGLLVRLIRFSESPVGRIVTQVDYSDYRDVSGVKMPFRWTVAWLDGRSTFELTEVRTNVPVDASRFARPAASK